MNNDKPIAIFEGDELKPDGTLIKKSVVLDLRKPCSRCKKILDIEDQHLTIHGEILCEECIGKENNYG